MTSSADSSLRARMIARLAARGTSTVPGIDGQFLAARRALGEDPDAYFALELSDGEWVLEWTRDRQALGRLPRAGLERYAEAVLAAKSNALNDALEGPLTLLAASELLDLPVDLVAAAVRDGSQRKRRRRDDGFVRRPIGLGQRQRRRYLVPARSDAGARLVGSAAEGISGLWKSPFRRAAPARPV